MIAAISTAVILSLFFMWCRRGGGGWFGRKVRNSDHWALEDAIREKEEEVARLYADYLTVDSRKSIDRYYVLMDWKDAKAELEQLIALRPKYPLDTESKTC